MEPEETDQTVQMRRLQREWSSSRINGWQQTVTGHQVINGAEGQHTVPLVFQLALNLAGSPARMAFMYHAQQGGDVIRRAVREMMRRAVPVLKPGSPLLSPALKPLIACGRENAIVTAQRTDVRPVLRDEQHKLGT